MLLKKKKIPKYVIDDIEISSDSAEENSDEENSDKQNSDEKNSDEENLKKIIYINHILKLILRTIKNIFFIYEKWLITIIKASVLLGLK